VLRRAEQLRGQGGDYEFHEHVKGINRGRDGRNAERGQVDLDERVKFWRSSLGAQALRSSLGVQVLASKPM
jgi:hypothetical protein